MLLQITLSRTRRLATSGDDVVAEGGGEHSEFAMAILTGLNEMNVDIFTVGELYVNFVARRVRGNTRQNPVYAQLRNSGDDNGEFIFVKKK